MTQPTVWRKPRKCDNSSGNCVEIGAVANTIAIRDSKNPSGPILIYGTDEFAAHVEAIKAGEYDDLI